MKNILILIILLSLNHNLLAQKKKVVVVKAGTKITDYFSTPERYLYPEFTEGTCSLTNGQVISRLFNYNLLSGEMDFIRAKDTLAISNKEQIKYITVAKDTFYYADLCMQLIKSNGLKVFHMQKIELVDRQKNGALGSTGRSFTIDSYDNMQIGKYSYNFKSDVDVIFRKKNEFFYFAGNGYILLNKKNAEKIVPEKQDLVKKYLKTNRIDFELKNDVLKFADFISSLSR
jgi:hypothetical protein